MRFKIIDNEVHFGLNGTWILLRDGDRYDSDDHLAMMMLFAMDGDQESFTVEFPMYPPIEVKINYAS